MDLVDKYEKLSRIEMRNRIKTRYEETGTSGVVINGLDLVLRKGIPTNVFKRRGEKLANSAIGREITKQEADKTISWGSSETIKVNPPISIQKLPDVLKEYVGSYKLKKPFVGEFNPGYVKGAKATGITSNHNILLDSMSSWRHLLVKNIINNPTDLYHFTQHSKKELKICNAVPLVTNFNHYYHWILNSLTRLEGVSRYEEHTNTNMKLIIPPNPPSWIIESLLFFGYSKNQLVEYKKRSYKINSLVIPSMRVIENNHILHDENSLVNKIVSPNALEWIRKSAEAKIKTNSNKYASKIIISRDDVGTRQINNRSDLLERLQSIGFETYVLADMNFAEQVSLFNQADCVIGVHGAGLVNMIFGKEMKIIEIFGENYIRPSFMLLSNSLDNQYGCYIGKQEPGRDGTVSVNMSDFNVLLEEMNVL